MMQRGRTLESPEHHEHMSWVRTRMTLDQDLMEWIRHGFSLITVGFGSFAFLEGVVGAFGEGERSAATEPSRIFSLIATAVGVILVAMALKHNRNMVEFVNADAFGDQEAPGLPNEKREEYLAVGSIVIGMISFVALLFLR
jgi:putative membrane protein